MTMIQDMDKLINDKYCKNKKIDMISIILYGRAYKFRASGMFIKKTLQKLVMNRWM